MKLVAGLGNPGSEYRNTRHNVGFDVLDILSGNARFLKKHSLSEIASYKSALLAKPQTFMNRSGDALRELLSYYHIEPSDMIVVCDDFALPSGVLRLRHSGSAGGHKGLSSIIDVLRTNDFPRLRVGVGCLPPETEPSAYVLKQLREKERSELEQSARLAAECVDFLLENGIEKAMNKYNKSAKP